MKLAGKNASNVFCCYDVQKCMPKHTREKIAANYIYCLQNFSFRYAKKPQLQSKCCKSINIQCKVGNYKSVTYDFGLTNIDKYAKMTKSLRTIYILRIFPIIKSKMLQTTTIRCNFHACVNRFLILISFFSEYIHFAKEKKTVFSS